MTNAPHPGTLKTWLENIHIFMPPKELWEAYSNRTVRLSVRQSVRPAFLSGPYLLYSLR